MIHKTLIFLFFVNISFAQVYVEKGKNRFTFAQTTIGVNTLFIPTSGNAVYLSSEGTIQRRAIPYQFRNRLVLSGMHFWGHADFYVSFPVTNIRTLINQEDEILYDKGPEMGARIFPWRLISGKIRPFAGISMNTITYQQKIDGHPEGSGLKQVKTKFITNFGAAIQSDKWLIEAGVNWAPFNKIPYYIDRQSKKTITTPPLHFLAGVRYIFDSTIPNKKSDSKEILARPQNSFTLGLGPSFSLFLGNSSYNESIRPFLGEHQRTVVFPEFGLGYYHYNFDFQINVAFRQMKSKLEAYGIEQTVGRKSLSLEGYKFLFDYHGFVPFAGHVLSYESLSFLEKENGQPVISETVQLLRPGFIFGWDIRPTDHQLLILRTNLRYFPDLSIDLPEGKKISLDQLEFNLIQVIVHLNRL